jgi:glycosyltransferase involved in cell wall biosynthesis
MSPADRIGVVHFGIDTSTGATTTRRVPWPRNRPTVLFLGRIPRQRTGQFIEVARRGGSHSGSAVRHTGTGDLLPGVIERTVELDLADRCASPGGEGPEVDRLYQSADVCVVPSVSEPLGLVALEASGGTLSSPSSGRQVLRHALGGFLGRRRDGEQGRRPASPRTALAELSEAGRRSAEPGWDWTSRAQDGSRISGNDRRPVT